MTGTLTVVQAAVRMGLCTKTVRRLIRDGLLTAYRVGCGRGRWQITPDAVAECLDRVYHRSAGSAGAG